MKRMCRPVLVASFAATLGCATMSAEVSNATGNYATQSEADGALLRFEAANPQCELWTNWQKMCSRTGADGKVSCIRTRRLDVRPSAPFCAATKDGARRPGPADGLKAVSSSLRFCRYPSGKPQGPSAQIESCIYEQDRPFSGRNLQDREHGWCRVWYEAGRIRPASRDRAAPNGLYCASRRVPDWCVFPDGLGRGPDLAAIRRMQGKGKVDDLFPGTLINPDAMPVRGVFCRRRIK